MIVSDVVPTQEHATPPAIPFIWVAHGGVIWFRVSSEEDVCLRGGLGVKVGQTSSTLTPTEQAWRKRLPTDQGLMMRNMW